jgi:hypothetical protein
MAHGTAENRRLRLLPAPAPESRRGEPDRHGTRPAGNGDQRIAWALYDAQIAGPAGSGRPRRRTLAEIVSMGGERRRWGLAFKQLKADGLVQEQTLGQVIARWSRGAGDGRQRE